MHKQVKIVFGPGKEFDLAVEAEEVLSFEASRQWLDEQFVRLGCEPMRGSGKVLVADKILGVAAALGPEGFKDAAMALDYARAASGALSKALLLSLIHILRAWRYNARPDEPTTARV